MLLVPLILFLPKARAWDRTLGVTLFFTFSCAAFSLGLFMPHHFQLFYYLSCGLLFLCAYMAFCVVSAPLAVAVHVTSGSVPEDTHALRGGASKAWGRKALGAVIVLALIAGGIFGARYYVGTLGTVAPPPPNATERAGEGEVELVFTGDVMLARNVERSLRSARRDFSFPFAECAAYTQGADLAFCNLESPISGRGEPIEKTYLFNAPPDALDGIYFAGFDVVSLANNHILDFGPVAMADTLRHLESRGIVPIGITMLDEAQAPFIRSVRGVRIAYLAYCDPVPKYSYAREFYVFDERPARATKENLARDITAAKESADIVVVSLHWGIEYQPEPNAHQRDLGRFIIDQGAHIVAGHHPHVQQEPETYKHGLIIHSMGNFVFDQHSRPPTLLSRLYRVYVNKEGIVRAEYLPLEIAQSIWQPKPTQGAFIAIQ